MKSVTVVKVGSLRDADPAKRGKIEVRDIPEQQLGDEDVKIKVAYCSICGSDPHLVENIFGWETPFGLGHEVSGVVDALGPKAVKRGLKAGDRVAGNFLKFCGTCYYCQNGQQQFCENADEYNRPGMSESIVWHESQVYKLPDGVSLKSGCLLEPISIAVRMMDKVGMSLGRRVAICGGGPIGLLGLQSIKMMGATSLTMIEPLENRRNMALAYGADYVIDPAADNVVKASASIPSGRGYDVVIDCSGSPKAVRDLPQITAKGGGLVYAAMYPNDYEMPLNLYKYCYFNEISITGLYVAPYAFPRAVQIMPRMKLDEFTGAIFDIDDAEAAFAEHLTGNRLKILIRCNKLDIE
ncbi:MAG: alcohol dehydrogenase catalytic domain-containing protein [Synergistaceae bacterium]|jgi:(R,R)-butanediol dehydrogenase/meso-butanediol dehydrogenase/diacetyl reductase/L-iditol 2-dehydrogenase|nr:alcohol dehydrogenase catalytic domain-containing protein [Synergistaceae bacterium]